MSTHNNCTVIFVSNAVRDTARLVHRSPCISLWVEISTLAYQSNSSCCPKRLSVAYCTHIIQTINAKKSEISTKINVFSHRSAHRHASCSAGVICRGCRVVTCNPAVNLLNTSWAPSDSWNFYTSHIVAFDLFCCHCRRSLCLSGIGLLQLC
jgi:hypothetical protein